MNEQLEQKAMDYSRGKIAGHDVWDDQGMPIVGRGEIITDEMIDRACKTGNLHYLMLAAVASVVQEGGESARERLQEFRDVTEGHEADFVRGKTAGRDVKDLEGNILVREGETISDEVIQQAQTKGLLQELVLGVGALGRLTSSTTCRAA